MKQYKQYVKTIGSILLVVGGVILLVYLITWKPTPSSTTATYTVTRKDVTLTLKETGIVITRLLDNDQIKVVQWYVAEDHVNQLSKDQPVTLDILALTTTVNGKIDSVASLPKITGDTTAYEVIVTFASTPDNVLDGMHVDVTKELASKTNVLAVPNTSLSKSDDTYTVTLVHEQQRIYLQRLGIDKTIQKLEPRTVTIGLAGDDYTEVTGGLSAGEIIAYD